MKITTGISQEEAQSTAADFSSIPAGTSEAFATGFDTWESEDGVDWALILKVTFTDGPAAGRQDRIWFKIQQRDGTLAKYKKQDLARYGMATIGQSDDFDITETLNVTFLVTYKAGKKPNKDGVIPTFPGGFKPVKDGQVTKSPATVGDAANATPAEAPIW